MSKKISIATLTLCLGFLFFSAALWGNELGYIQAALQFSGARWTAGETSISKLTPHERRMRLGALKPALTGTETFLTPHLDTIMALPQHFDWRSTNGKNYVTPVRNQASCGSCWAFAATAALESVTLIAQESPGVDLNLAEQILVSTCSSAGDCGGGYPGGAANFIKNIGLPLETCYPYRATNSECSEACSNWQDNTYRIKDYYVVGSWSPTPDDIKSALFQYGPLPTTLDVYTDFFSYQSGVYSLAQGCCADSKACPKCHYEGGHAVLIVGYDDEEEYFIVKNSWGTGWGESGYFRIDYSQLTNDVAFGQYTLAYETEADITSHLTILKTGEGRGEIFAEGLLCDSDSCEGEYLTGTTVTVTARAASGYVLEDWTGCDSVVGQSCIVQLNQDVTAIANFLPPPQLSTSARSLQFGLVRKGLQSPVQSFIVENTGNARLSISSLEVEGIDKSDFSYLNGCVRSLWAGESCTIDVTVLPGDYGKRNGELRIFSNDVRKQPFYAIKMTANAKPPKIAIKPSTVRFEPLGVSNVSEGKTITIENRGLSDLLLNSPNTESIADFSVVNNCPGTLAGGLSCTMDFRFQPSDVGLRTGSVTVYSNDPKKPSATVKLSGKGE